MNSFNYYMPTRVFFGKRCISENKEFFKLIGRRALIVTGGGSAKKNGALADVTEALTTAGISYFVFDKTEQNPSVENVAEAGRAGIEFGADFVIGIGGGSPMDTAKAASFLLANPGLEAREVLFGAPLKKTPLVEIPTTAGTGSEVTAVSVVTMHDKKTKGSIAQKGFAEAAFIDARYTEKLPADIANNTAIDALAHIIEGYMNTGSNIMSDCIAESGLSVFRECIPSLLKREYTEEIREKLLVAAAIGGIVIAQTGTSLPHAMGYCLTYLKDIPHGRACGLLLKEYLRLFTDDRKRKNILVRLGFCDLDDFGKFIDSAIPSNEVFTEDEINSYTDEFMKNTVKLRTHPELLERRDIYNMYKKSLIK